MVKKTTTKKEQVQTAKVSTQSKVKKPIVKKNGSTAPATGKDLDLKIEMVNELLERGKKNGYMTYEEIIEFSEKNNLGESDTNDLLRRFEKEHVDVVMQEELEGGAAGLEEFGPEDEEFPAAHLKTKLESSLDLHGEL